MAAEAPSQPPAPELEWVILAGTPRVAPDDSFPPGEHVALREDTFRAPPGLSFVTMSRSVCPDETSPRNYPRVIAADPSGTVLLHATQGRAEGPHILAREDLYICQQREFNPGYILANPFTRVTEVLPSPPELPVFDPGNLGLLADPNNTGHFAVADLQLACGTGHATLLVYSTARGAWDEKRTATFPRGYPPTWPRNGGVVAHGGRLWWVHLALGLFACDPFAPQPVKVRFVPLPDGCILPPTDPGEGIDIQGFPRALEKKRCVRSVAGKLRYAQIDRNNTVMDFTMWSLAEDGKTWELDYRVPLDDIWAHPSYQATRLAKVFPVIMLLHPRNPDVVYFWLLGRIFTVDLRAKVVLDCKPFQLDFPLLPQYYSSRALHAWELPATPPPVQPASSGSKRDKKKNCCLQCLRTLCQSNSKVNSGS